CFCGSPERSSRGIRASAASDSRGPGILRARNQQVLRSPEHQFRGAANAWNQARIDERLRAWNDAERDPEIGSHAAICERGREEHGRFVRGCERGVTADFLGKTEGMARPERFELPT